MSDNLNTCPHFAELVFVQAEKYKDKNALWYRNDATETWEGISWKQLAFRVKCTAAALCTLGVEAENKIAIFSQNKPESFMVDFACFVLRSVSVPLYATSTAQQVDYIVNDASIEIIFVGEQYQYDVAREVLQSGKGLKKIIVFDNKVKTDGEEHSIYFQDFLKDGENNLDGFDLDAFTSKASADDLASILYTSGTSGEPKGVMLAHSNYLEAMRIHLLRLTAMSESDRSLSFLPVTHVFERAWCYLCLFRGVEIYVNLRPQDIQRSVREVKPTLMCAVPRFWEKVFIEVKERFRKFSPLMQGVIAWSLAVGRKHNLSRLRTGKKPSLWLAVRYKMADKLLFSQVKETLGVENGNFFPVAGAPLSDDIMRFFRSIGIPLLYGYGLTESTATVSCFEYTNYEIGTIGRVMPDLQVRIGEDNEILLKGGTITKGYFNRPELNKITFTEDGFFRTGDAGFLKDNQIILTERIKDLIKTSNGKYVAPQQIELKLTQDKYIEQAAVIGDERNYVTALIVPAFERLKEYANENKIEYADISDLLINPAITSMYKMRIAEHQQGMAGFEQIKKFTLIPNGFSMETGELTNTLKLRRSVIAHRYKPVIDGMYEN